VTFGSRLRALRFDGLWWRKFAYLGSVYGPEWWKRYSPPWIAAIIYLCVGRNRRGALANIRRILGRRGWLRDNLAALDVFISFAHCMNEALEYFSPRPQPVRVDEPSDDPIKAAIGRGKGAVLVTCHFGNWDIGARTLARFGCPFNLVMASEANETTADYVRQAREDAGVRVLLSDQSVYGSFNMLRALKRNEIVAMQLDRPLGGDGARLVDFFGAPAWFQAGPIRLARLAGAPIFPVFALRVGVRHYRIVLGTEHHASRHATVEEIDRILESIVGEFEQLVRVHAEQWFQFAPYWPEDAAAAAAAGDEPRIQSREPTRARAS
jgi:KDO2-lipid IV(A) lauroyltransferase